MNKPLVSVIIPTKNEEKVLDACLRSLAAQHTDEPFEILIIDTNSTDATRAIATRYTTRVISESRPGRNVAHQTGVKNAKGQLLCFTEADCILPPNWIATFVRAFRNNPRVAAWVGRYQYHQSTPLLTAASLVLMPIFDTLYHLIHGHWAFRASNFAIRKSILLKAGGFNLKAREFDDVELSMRVAKIAKIQYLPSLVIKTGDRRVRGRLLPYLKEAIHNYINTCILKRTVSQKVFADIR